MQQTRLEFGLWSPIPCSKPITVVLSVIDVKKSWKWNTYDQPHEMNGI